MKRLWLGFPIVLAVAALLVYGRSLSGGFLNWDDQVYVIGEPMVTQLSWQNIARAFTSAHFTDYAPFNTIAIMLEYAAWGPSPMAFRVTNLFLHVLNASLVFLILVQLPVRRNFAAIGALAFLAHPAQVEAVAWIAEHKLLLSTGLLLGAMLVHVRGGPRWLRTLLGVAAMLAKPSAIVLPLLIVLYDAVVQRRRLRAAIVDQIPLLLFAAFSAAMNVVAQHARGTVVDYHGGLAHAWGIFCLPGRYLAKTIWPEGLCAVYRFSAADLLAPATAAYAAVTLAIVALLLLVLRRRAVVAFGIAWWFVALLPVSQIIPFPVWMADRYLYLPLAGAVFGVAAAAGEISPGRGARALTAILLAATIALGVTSHRRSLFWTTDLRLWSEAARCDPSNFTATNLAWALMEGGELSEAAEEIDHAIAIGPDAAESYAVRGEIRLRQGLREDAARDFMMAVELNPKNEAYRRALAALSGEAPVEIGREVRPAPALTEPAR